VLEHVGRIAHEREHAAIADIAQDVRIGSWAENGRLVDLPVAGMKYVAERRLNQNPIPLWNGMRQRDEADPEWAELDASAALDDIELHVTGEPLLFELAGDQARRERRREQRRFQLLGEIGQRADMVLVTMSKHDPGKAILLPLNKLQLRQDQLDAGIGWVGEGETEVDHDPLAATAVQIDVHADLARAAEGDKQQFLSRNHCDDLVAMSYS